MSLDPNLHELTVDSPPAVAELARAARELLLSELPEARQEFNPGWGGYLMFKPAFQGSNAVCWLTSHSKHVSIGFAQGAALSDPAGLLEGKGKHSRQVRVKSPEVLERPELRRLIAEAWSLQPDLEVMESGLERVREICLSFPETSETVSHGHPNFWAGKKTFAVYGLYSPSVAFKAAVSMHLELEGDGRIFPTPYMANKGWLSLRLNADTDWAMARRLLEHSYREVATRKLLAALDAK